MIPDCIIAAGSNCLWIFNQTMLSETMDDLEQVTVDIGCDQFENEPYTKDEAAMAALRVIYKERLAVIRKGNDGRL